MDLGMEFLTTFEIHVSLKDGIAMRPLITACWTLAKTTANARARTDPIIVNAPMVILVNYQLYSRNKMVFSSFVFVLLLKRCGLRTRCGRMQIGSLPQQRHLPQSRGIVQLSVPARFYR